VLKGFSETNLPTRLWEASVKFSMRNFLTHLAAVSRKHGVWRKFYDLYFIFTRIIKRGGIMSKHAICCIATTEAQAEAIVSELQAKGFSNDDISILFPDQHGHHGFRSRKTQQSSGRRGNGREYGRTFRRRFRASRRHRQPRNPRNWRFHCSRSSDGNA